MRNLILCLCLLTLPALADPPEAQHAVDVLQSKGIVQGYPGGDFQGQRAISRYEAAQIMEKVERYLEDQLKDLAPRSDVQSLKSATEALKQGLEDMGARTGRLDSDVKSQDRRLEEK